jgi:hypothetical protein
MDPRGPAAPERIHELIPWGFEENVKTEAANESGPTRDDGHAVPWRLDYTHCLGGSSQDDMFRCSY